MLGDDGHEFVLIQRGHGFLHCLDVAVFTGLLAVGCGKSRLHARECGPSVRRESSSLKSSWESRLGKRAAGVEVWRGMGLSLSELRDGLPEGGLFGGGAWRWSPEPLKLSKAQAREMMSLGHPLARFQQACDTIYRRSASGKLPGWLTELLDEGKPEWMVRLQHEPSSVHQFPRVIRPDLILTENGFALTELDSVHLVSPSASSIS